MIALAAILMVTSVAPPKKIAVLDLVVKHFDKDQVDLFNELLQNQLRARGYKVIARSDIEAMLGLEKLAQLVAGQPANFNVFSADGKLQRTILHGRVIQSTRS